MFIAPSFTVVKMWIQPKFPLVDEWRLYIYILFSYKNKGNPAICDNVTNLEGIMPSKISQREKDKHHVTSLTCEI